jgi:polyphenol oxidase
MINYYYSKLLSDQESIIHAFSGKIKGDCRKKEVRQKILNDLHISNYNLTLMQQLHGSIVVSLSNPIVPKIVPKADGLVYKKRSSGSNHALGVRIADCVPILLFDPVKKIITGIHSGWRGTLSHIVLKAIFQMKKLGSDTANIIAVSGPHIGACCYEIDALRAKAFISVFGKDTIRKINDGNYSLDLSFAIQFDLLSQGILKKNIEDMNLCTACRPNEFYSYRKDHGKGYGVQMGIIALR